MSYTDPSHIPSGLVSSSINNTSPGLPFSRDTAGAEEGQGGAGAGEESQSFRMRFLPSDQQHYPLPPVGRESGVAVSASPPKNNSRLMNNSRTRASSLEAETKPLMKSAVSYGELPTTYDTATSAQFKAQMSGYSAPVFHVSHLHKKAWIDQMTDTGYFRAFQLMFREGGDEEEEELKDIRDRVKGGTSTLSTFLILLKGFIGTGILFLPKAWAQGGILASSLFFLVVALWCTYNIVLLVDCKKKVGNPSFGFGDLAGVAYGKWCENTVNGFIVLVQFSIVCVYVGFVAENLHAAILHFSGCKTDISVTVLIWASLAFYVPLILIRKVKLFAIPSLIADVCIMTGLVYVLVHDFRVADDWYKPEMFVPSTFAMYVSAAVFAFEGVQLCLPIEEAMADRSKFVPVVYAVCAICAVIYVSFGCFGYLAFGSKVDGVVLLSLPQNSQGPSIIQLMYAVAIFCSLPLQFFPATRIVESWVGFKIGTKTSLWPKMKTNLLRIFTLLVLALIATFGSTNLSNFVSLSSAFSAIPLAFIIPAAIHFKLVAQPGSWSRILDVVISIAGFGVAVFATAVAVWQWIETGASPGPVCKTQ